MLEGLQPENNRAYYCKVETLRNELDPKDFAILETALADDKLWSANGLSKALRKRGVVLADTTIGKHRNKQCWCFRKLG